jgi:threonine dehydratase
MARSLERGAALLELPATEPTVAEGLEGGVADRTFRFAREALAPAGVRLVRERAIRRAIGELDARFSLAVEGSGAVTLAALNEGLLDPVPARGATVLVLTGGNVDPERVRACRAEAGA